MSFHLRRWAVLLSLCWLGHQVAWAAAPPPSDAYLRKLVRALGSDDFETRQEATERLRGYVAAADLLEEAALSSDAEVRGSARALLDEIDARRAGPISLRMA